VQITVLVVDNDPGELELLRENLGQAGFRVITAKNGTQALAKASSYGPDIVLLDTVLPDVDGIEVCRKLKGQPDTKGIPVVLMSSKASTKNTTVAIAAGAQDCIEKSLAPDQVVTTVEAQLRDSRARKTANPATGLPDATVVASRIGSLIEGGKPFAVAYVDVNGLDTFTCARGSTEAANVVQLTAGIALEATQLFGEEDDLVGHYEAHTIAVVTQPHRVEAVCRQIIREFDTRILMFYKPVDRQREYGEVEIQPGIWRKYPIMSVSIAVVSNERRAIGSLLDVTRIAAQLRHHVQMLPRSNYCIDRRREGIVVPDNVQEIVRSPDYGEHLSNLRRLMSRMRFMARTLTPAATLVTNALDSLLTDEVEAVEPVRQRSRDLVESRFRQLVDLIRELDRLGDIDVVASEGYSLQGLKEIVDSAINMVNGFAAERGVHIERRGNHARITMMVDASRLVEGLSCLLEGIISACASGDSIEIRVGSKTRSSVVVHVESSGCPLCVQDQQMAVEVEPRPGTGPSEQEEFILAKALLHSCGARLEVANGMNGGVSFSIRVPRQWKSRSDRINRFQMERERIGRASRARCNKVRDAVGAALGHVPSDLDDDLQDLELTSRELEVLCNLSLLLADELHGDLEKRERQLSERDSDNLAALDIVLSLIGEVVALEGHQDPVDMDSARRVSRLSLAIADQLKLPRNERVALHQAALMRDLGPALTRPSLMEQALGPTTDEQTTVRERVSQAGKGLVQLGFLQPALELASHRYERYDGTGYPLGLKGEEIPLGARILAVAETVESLVWGLWPLAVLELDAAAKELIAEAGRRFDPAVVEVFLRVWRAGKLTVK